MTAFMRSTVHTIEPRRVGVTDQPLFCKPGHTILAYVYGEQAAVVAAILGWPNLRVISATSYMPPSMYDYVLPVGALRLHLDLCAAFGEPA